MCSFKNLSHNANGYVSRCNDCGYIQLAFGTTVLSLNAEQFYEFCETIEYQLEANKYRHNRDHKLIHIATAARYVTLLYSINELASLHLLLSEAETALNKEILFQFHKN